MRISSENIRFFISEENEIVSDSDNIKREADKLIEIRLKDGTAEWNL